MNTYEHINEYTDIDNIPLNKWFHIALCVKQDKMNIFVNGNLKESYIFNSLPKQNYGDLYINSLRGFSGFLSRIKYYSYYLPYSELDAILKQGPAMIPCEQTGETPPYISSDWWFEKN